MKSNPFLIILLFSFCSIAQQITTGKITNIKVSGLHKIMLPAEIRTFSKEDLSDFRIYDSQQREVPYYLIPGNSPMMLKEFEEYILIKDNHVSNTSTRYMIDTQSKQKINGISLTIANSDMVKKYTLRGSNDRKNWRTIAENGVLSGLKNEDNTSVVKDISFPLSAFRYLQIEFDDLLTEPINLLQAGIRKHEIRENNLQGIVPKSVTTTLLKEQKITTIHVVFEHKQTINRINFDVRHPKYFSRPVSIYKDPAPKVKRKNITFHDLICKFDLSSQAKTSFDLPQIALKEMEIEITNHTNEPLDIASLHFSQLPAYAIANLDPAEQYTIKTGHPELMAPKYDLAKPDAKNLSNYPEIAVTAIEHDKAHLERLAEKASWRENWLIWIGIGIVGVILLFFTTTILKTVRQS